MQFSLSLKPAEDVYNGLSELIALLGERYSLATFPPHVTLLDRLTGPGSAVKNIVVGHGGVAAEDSFREGKISRRVLRELVR